MNNTQSVWVADDEKSIRWVLEKALRRAGLQVQSFASGDALLAALEREQPDLIISDIRMPGTDGLSLLRHLNNRFAQIPVIIMTAHSDLQSAVDSYQGGAFEYLPKPFDLAHALSLARRALEHRQSADAAADAAAGAAEIIGEAPAMQAVFRTIGRLARSNATVLLGGASGTGKELVARALHRHSPRCDKSFIALNMAAIPAELIESELFGHEKGAFTGAAARRPGRFEQADGGTLFLDEIGDMPFAAQTRLLRVLADGEFYRIGGHNSVRVNVRIITATHQDLERMVAEQRFREDLFHRLNVIRIQLPTLAERPGDIPALARHFMRRAATELQMECKTLLPETEQRLAGLPWPGNVRQLENACRWLTVMAPGRDIHPGDLPPELLANEAESEPPKNSLDKVKGATAENSWSALLQNWALTALLDGQRQILKSATPMFESAMIAAALEHSGGRKNEAAELLGWGRNTLTRKLKELELDDFSDGD